jgi:hypothetical protein
MIKAALGLDHRIGHLASVTVPRQSASRHRVGLPQKTYLGILSQAFFP